MVARDLLVGWLERRGVEAELKIERLELDGFVGEVILRDPADADGPPQASVRRVEVDWVLSWPWAEGGVGPRFERIRLVGPVLRARWTGERLSFGVLDPIVEELAKRPARPGVAGPLILIEQADVRLATDWGEARLLGDGRLEEGRLTRLVARMPSADLRRGDRFLDDVSATVDLAVEGERAQFRVTAAAAGADLGLMAGEGVRLTAEGTATYPDLERISADGPVDLAMVLDGGRLRLGETSIGGASGRLDFSGRVRGAGEDLGLDGRSNIRLAAASVEGPVRARRFALAGRQVRLRFGGSDGRDVWRLDGPLSVSAGTLDAAGWRVTEFSAAGSAVSLGGRGDAFEAVGPVNLRAGRAVSGDLTLAGVEARLNADLVSDGAVDLTLRGSATARSGAWPILGRPAADDLPELAAMKRALMDFSLSAPALTLVSDAQGLRMTLDRPAVATPAIGGRLTLAASSRPVLSSGAGGTLGGALTLTSAGGPLPTGSVTLTEWRSGPAGFQTALNGRLALDFGIGRGLILDGAGRLTAGAGGVVFAADRCVAMTAERLELGENDVTDLSADVCPADAPLFRLSGATWRSQARLANVKAAAPFLAVTVEEGRGTLGAVGGPSGVGLDLRAETAALLDATRPLRFNPLTGSGRAVLAADRWTGDFDLSRSGTPVARLNLTHDGPSGLGGVQIVTPEIQFQPEGLQPSDLTPIGETLVQSPVSGRVRFEGALNWTPEGGTSGGVATLSDLDFQSPAGPVEGLEGRIVLTNLAPLETAPDQVLTARAVNAFARADGVRVQFELDKSAVVLDGAELTVAGGRLRLEPLSLPLAPATPWTGVVVVEEVQLGEIVSAQVNEADGEAAGGLAEAVDIDAVVSGRVPFQVSPEGGVTVRGGGLYAVRPGRLSIRREALSGLEAGGGGEAPPGVVEDLAYQAMENLAFEELTAAVDSLDGGRLGVRFHILGRHDPPQRQEIRLSWLDLIQRRFLDRNLPLPSDTRIDLTLDTTLNIDQLLADIQALNRARAGEP